MGSIANKTTFWHLLTQTGIKIPIIQRDYAQGRKGKEALREQFLEDLKKAMDNSLCISKDHSAIILDFVYGTKDESNYFIPIDGQQRLTTLWLLHWYIAYRAGKLNEESTRLCLNRFTYLTRDSSKAFCEKMVSEGQNLPNFINGQNIADIILNQTWMFNHWKQDPTVQSMLRMLSGVRDNEKNDGIEELFGQENRRTFNSYWDKLTATSPEDCPIVFYLLQLENVGQSDELYVKMNGRGKPLTDFENFKADLIKYIDDKYQEAKESSAGTTEGSLLSEWEKFNHPETGFANKLDNDWMDYFWEYRNPFISIDEMYFTFINRFFLVNLMQMHDELDNSSLDSKNKEEQKMRIVYDYLYSYVGEVKVEGSDVIHIPYSKHGFRIYQDIFNLLSPCETSDNGCMVLLKFYQMMENMLSWQKSQSIGRNRVEKIIDNPYSSRNQHFRFVYAEDSTSEDGFKKSMGQLQQPQQIAFWAVCYYFSSQQFNFGSPESLKRWMRIIWNICSVPSEIQNKDLVIKAIYKLSKYVKNPIEANSEFRKITLPAKKDIYKLSAFDKHIREEKEKAIHMLWNNGKYYGCITNFKGKTWEEVINMVESEEFLKGNIHCLFDQYEDGDINISWDDFDKRYNNLLLHKKSGFGIDSLKSTLLVSESRIRDDWYTSDLIDLNWRPFLLKYSKDVTEWLDRYGPVYGSPSSKYHLDLLLNTNLLKLGVKLALAQHKNSIHLASNSSTGIPVLMHHQASLPYILLNEKRNKILGELISNRVIIGDKSRVRILTEKHDPGIPKTANKMFQYNGVTYRFAWNESRSTDKRKRRTKRKVLNGANIEFQYLINGTKYEFVWNASGTIELKDKKSSIIVPAKSVTDKFSFLSLLVSMANKLATP